MNQMNPDIERLLEVGRLSEQQMLRVGLKWELGFAEAGFAVIVEELGCAQPEQWVAHRL